jgi:hypothetical protein
VSGSLADGTDASVGIHMRDGHSAGGGARSSADAKGLMTNLRDRAGG